MAWDRTCLAREKHYAGAVLKNCFLGLTFAVMLFALLFVVIYPHCFVDQVPTPIQFDLHHSQVMHTRGRKYIWISPVSLPCPPSQLIAKH